MEDDTRADIARRRLAALTAEFDRRYGADAPGRDPAHDPVDVQSDGQSDGHTDHLIEGQTGRAEAEPPEAGQAARPGHRRARHAAARRGGRLQWRLSAVHVRVVVAIVAAGVVATAWWLVASRPHQSEAAPSANVDTSSHAGQDDTADTKKKNTGKDKQLIIDVAGKVKDPGIVELPAGSRVVDAIKEAGGTKSKADTTSLNMARELQDGEQILVGDEGGSGDAPNGDKGGDGGGDKPGSGPKVNVNTADTDELETLPGVGPATAQAIIDHREQNGGFTQIDDLTDVKGIGPATLEDLKDLVTV